MHPNDTLQGKLFAWEREDEKHLRHSLGYWMMVEKRMIRAEIAAEGGDPADVFEIAARRTALHANDETFADQCRRMSAEREASALVLWLSGDGQRGLDFTKTELEFLRDHFEGANDPTAQTILAKVLTALS